MIEEIKDKYSKFVKEKDLSGRNYKVEYSYIFIPKYLWSCITNIRYTKDVVKNKYTDNLEATFKNKSSKDIENYLYQWKVK